MKSLIIQAAKEAGKIQLKRFGKIKFVKTKDKKSYFTNVDLECEKIIINSIRKKFPKHNIISEESAKIDNQSDYTWYIDPLDGTHNYIKGFPLFGVSIGLERKGKMKFGVINLPFFKEIYFAEKGKGAFLNGKKIKVSDNKDLKKSLIITDMSLRDRGDIIIEILNKLRGNSYDMRSFGCAVYGYTSVAKGNADIYYTTYTHPWDVAAGALIVEESNGKVTGFKGEPWHPNNKKFVASNKKIHNKILKIIK